jgi:DNA-binding transcriptional ArsR family regulator
LFNIIFYEVSKVLSSAKNEIPSDEHQLDLLFRALGDQTRRTLLASLMDKPAMVTELAEPFAMSLPAVSRHIRVLEGAGLVHRAIDGRVHRCSLSAEPLKNVEVWLRQYRRFWKGTLDSLARYVADDVKKKL